jgi:hypothetical protein
MTLSCARKFQNLCGYSSPRQYLAHSGDRTFVDLTISPCSEDPARKQLTSHPSHDPPTCSVSPLKALSPSRALSPPRSSTRSRASSRTPARSHSPPPSIVIIPPTPTPPLHSDASYIYRTSSSAPRKVKVRQGFWNRRGDCATPDGQYFVRAPPDHQNPPELSHLHQCHFSSYDGRTIAWDRRMKEYPDSLSKHGQPARYPYEYVRASFIIAGYFSNTLLQFFKYIEVNESDLRTPEFPSP